MVKRFYTFKNIDFVFDSIFNTNDMNIDFIYNWFKIKRNSLRYYVFKNSRKCVSCWIEWTFFALEKNEDIKDNRAHFNLYAIDKKWKEVLMTKDHIKPRSKWGTDDLKNLQTMCTVCNCNKWNKIKN